MLTGKEILVCVASKWEDKPCQAGIRDSGHSDAFSFLKTGMGMVNAEASLSRYLRKNNPKLIISSGIAGAVSAHIPELYSWINAEQVFFESRRVPNATFPVLLKDVTQCAIVSLSRAFRQGNPVPEILTPYPGPKAVDMESAALAQIAKQYQIPFMVLRLVTDTPNKPVPNFLSNLSEKFFSGEKINIPAELLRDPLGVLQTILRLREASRLLQTGWTKFAPEVTHFVKQH